MRSKGKELFLFTREKRAKRSAQALKDALYLQFCLFVLHCVKAAEEGQQTGKEKMYT